MVLADFVIDIILSLVTMKKYGFVLDITNQKKFCYFFILLRYISFDCVNVIDFGSVCVFGNSEKIVLTDLKEDSRGCFLF